MGVASEEMWIAHLRLFLNIKVDVHVYNPAYSVQGKKTGFTKEVVTLKVIMLYK